MVPLAVLGTMHGTYGKTDSIWVQCDIKESDKESIERGIDTTAFGEQALFNVMFT